MDSSQILVTFGALAEAQTTTTTTAAALRGKLDDLQAYLAPLIATWEGQASASYQGHQAQWNAAATELESIMRQISGALGSALEQYQSTEAANAAMWG